MDKNKYESLLRNGVAATPLEMGCDEINELMKIYDREKGPFRKLFSWDSGPVKKVKKILSECKEHQINDDKLHEIQSAVSSHMTPKVLLKKKWALTTKIFRNFEALKSNSLFVRFCSSEELSLKTFSYLNDKDRSSLGQVNKRLRSVTHFDSNGNSFRIFATEFRDNRFNALLSAMTSLLGKYQIERDFKNYHFRKKIFGEIDKKHVNRIKSFKMFIHDYFGYRSQKGSKEAFSCIIHKIIVEEVKNLYEYSTIKMDHQPFDRYERLFLNFDSEKKEEVDFESAMDFSFIYRIAMEIDYANQKKSMHYRETLVKIVSLFFQYVDQNKFLTKYKAVISSIEKEIDAYKSDLNLWNYCYVWRGYDGFVSYHISNKIKAACYYTTGREREWVIEGGGGTAGGEFSTGSDTGSISLRVVREGVSSDLKYYFPYRDGAEFFAKSSRVLKMLCEDVLHEQIVNAMALGVSTLAY